jgi:hypothetical protein
LKTVIDFSQILGFHNGVRPAYVPLAGRLAIELSGRDTQLHKQALNRAIFHSSKLK